MTKDTDNPVNQSLEANEWSWLEAQKTRSSELRLVFVLPLIGRESGARLLN